MHKLDRLEELIDGAEELLTQLRTPRSPKHPMAPGPRRPCVATPRAHSRGRATTRRATPDVAITIDDCVRDYPWLGS